MPLRTKRSSSEKGCAALWATWSRANLYCTVHCGQRRKNRTEGRLGKGSMSMNPWAQPSPHPPGLSLRAWCSLLSPPRADHWHSLSAWVTVTMARRLPYCSCSCPFHIPQTDSPMSLCIFTSCLLVSYVPMTSSEKHPISKIFFFLILKSAVTFLFKAVPRQKEQKEKYKEYNLGMMVYTCNPKKDHRFEANLGRVLKPCLKIKNEKGRGDSSVTEYTWVCSPVLRK